MASSHLTVPMGGLVEFNPWNQMTQLANKIIAHWQRICYFKVRKQSMITTVYQTDWLTVISGSMKTNKNLTRRFRGEWRELEGSKSCKTQIKSHSWSDLGGKSIHINLNRSSAAASHLLLWFSKGPGPKNILVIIDLHLVFAFDSDRANISLQPGRQTDRTIGLKVNKASHSAAHTLPWPVRNKSCGILRVLPKPRRGHLLH